jgi:hypothetical protein
MGGRRTLRRGSFKLPKAIKTMRLLRPQPRTRRLVTVEVTRHTKKTRWMEVWHWKLQLLDLT